MSTAPGTMIQSQSALDIDRSASPREMARKNQLMVDHDKDSSPPVMPAMTQVTTLA